MIGTATLCFSSLSSSSAHRLAGAKKHLSPLRKIANLILFRSSARCAAAVWLLVGALLCLSAATAAYSSPNDSVVTDGLVATLAGSAPLAVGPADDGKGGAASFSAPARVAVDSAGNIYVADSQE
jgi:hypothetical protein